MGLVKKKICKNPPLLAGRPYKSPQNYGSAKLAAL